MEVAGLHMVYRMMRGGRYFGGADQQGQQGTLVRAALSRELHHSLVAEVHEGPHLSLMLALEQDCPRGRFFVCLDNRSVLAALDSGSLDIISSASSTTWSFAPC